MKFIFGYPTIDETYDSPSPLKLIPEANKPVTFDYSYSKDNLSLQVLSIVTDSKNIIYRRLEDFKIDESFDCVEKSIKQHLLDLGINGKDVESLLGGYNFDLSKIHDYYHFGFK